jgi:GNAT superfamily N-acetyltransferase
VTTATVTTATVTTAAVPTIPAARSSRAAAGGPRTAVLHTITRATGPAPVPIPRPETTTVWWALLEHRDGTPVERSLVAVNSDRFPDATPVDLTAVDPRGRRPAGWLVDVRFRAAGGTVRWVDVAPEVAPTAPPLWFVELPHADSALPMTTLAAFAADAPGGYPPGAFVPPSLAAARGADLVADRVGELRWCVRSGVVETVAVVPGHRRRGVGRVLVLAAEGLRAHRGWAPLRSDGRLTDAGAAWLAGSPAAWAPRLARRTAALPDADAPVGPRGIARLMASLA